MMRGTTIARCVLVAGMMLAAAGLAGCSKGGVDGKYVMQGGLATIEFKGGKATVTSTTMGGPDEVQTVDYVQDGDKVTVKSKEGDMVFTLTKEGNLEGMMGTFKKSAG